MTAESVIVSPDGRAMMLNKFGGVFEAYEGADGNYTLNRTAKAWLGPGRPLGAAFDAAGNIIICDALKVFSQHNLRQIHITFATAFPAGHAVLVASIVALICDSDRLHTRCALHVADGICLHTEALATRLLACLYTNLKLLYMLLGMTNLLMLLRAS